MEERMKRRACKHSQKWENKDCVYLEEMACFGFIVHLLDKARGATVGVFSGFIIVKVRFVSGPLSIASPSRFRFWIISLNSSHSILSFSLWSDIWICWTSAEVYHRMFERGLIHAKTTAAAIMTASSRIHWMKYYGCQMAAWVIFNLLYITWAERSSFSSVSLTAMFKSVLRTLKFLSSFNLPTVSFY